MIRRFTSLLGNIIIILSAPHAVTFEMYTLKNLSSCLLYTSDAADERSSVDLGGRRIIKKKKKIKELAKEKEH